jgi:dTDP-4-dehydrorhamnose 3,5-epimerase
MNAIRLSIPELIVLEPKIHGDDRGFFFESYNARDFHEATGLKMKFMQDNHSLSRKGVLRGLHYQLPPHAQGKLVRVVRGAIFDVAVDVRASSPSFGRWDGVELSAENKKQLWIPPGFAHGFLTLSEKAEVLYKATEFYSPESERSILWDDPEIGITWSMQETPIISDKDRQGKRLAQAEIFE